MNLIKNAMTSFAVVALIAGSALAQGPGGPGRGGPVYGSPVTGGPGHGGGGFQPPRPVGPEPVQPGRPGQPPFQPHPPIQPQPPYQPQPPHPIGPGPGGPGGPGRPPYQPQPPFPGPYRPNPPPYGGPVYGSPVYGSPVYGQPVYNPPVFRFPTYPVYTNFPSGPCTIYTNNAFNSFYTVTNAYGQNMGGSYDYYQAQQIAQNGIYSHQCSYTTTVNNNYGCANYCQIQPGSNAYGQQYYNVVASSGAIIDSTSNYQQALNDVQNDSQCYQ